MIMAIKKDCKYCRFRNPIGFDDLTKRKPGPKKKRGPKPGPDPTKRRSFTIRDSDWEYLKRMAESLGISVSEFIRRCISGEMWN